MSRKGFRAVVRRGPKKSQKGLDGGKLLKSLRRGPAIFQAGSKLESSQIGTEKRAFHVEQFSLWAGSPIVPRGTICPSAGLQKPALPNCDIHLQPASRHISLLPNRPNRLLWNPGATPRPSGAPSDSITKICASALRDPLHCLPSADPAFLGIQTAQKGKTWTYPNAFIAQETQPTETELASALGPSAEAWKQFIDWLATEQGVTQQEWKSISPKYGWSLRLKLKKRTILYLAPCDGCFRVAFALGDHAVKAARESLLSKSVLKIIDEAPRYAEGTGVRLTVKGSKDLAPIRKLAKIKLAN